MRVIQRLIKDCNGNVAILVALAAPVLFGAAALAVDASRLYFTREKLQDAADAAAVAGARQLPDEDETAIKQAAMAYAADSWNREILTETDIEIGRWEPSTRGCAIDTSSSEPNAVRVVTRRAERNDNPVNLFFAPLFTLLPDRAGTIRSDVAACAIAGRTAQKDPCLLILDSSAQKALLTDSNSSLTADDCGLHSNSDHPQTSFVANSNTNVEAAFISAVGGTEVKSNSTVNPSPRGNAAPIPDPLQGLGRPPEADNACDTNQEEFRGEPKLSPGVYCGGLRIKDKNTTVELESGTYIIRDKPFQIDQNVTVTGDEVTIYLQGKDAKFLINSNSTLDIAAPRSGQLEGIAVYEEQAKNCGTRECRELEHSIKSNTTVTIDGSMYFPRGELLVDSNSGVEVKEIIAREFELKSNASLTLTGGEDGPSGSAQVGLLN